MNKKSKKKNSEFQMTTNDSYSNGVDAANEKHVHFTTEKVSMMEHGRMSRHPYHHASLKDFSSSSSSSSSSSASSSLKNDCHVTTIEYPTTVSSFNFYESENEQQRVIPDAIHGRFWNLLFVEFFLSFM
jgi:hypothetical protein